MDLPDVSVTWVISVSATVLLLTYFWFSRPNPKCPPCPLKPWPIVGNMLQLNKDPREQMVGFRKQCGDIYSLYLGPTHVVMLNGLDLVKETFVKRGDDFSDRAVIFLDHVTDGINKGISAASGAVWKEHRVFATSVMRDFGLGKNILTGKIQEEVNYFIEQLESFNGEPTNMHPFIAVSVSNIICSMIVGQRYEYDDKEFQRLLEICDFIFSNVQGTIILNYFPWLRFLPGDLFYCKLIEQKFHEFYDIFARVHIKENEDVVGEPGNYIAAYLQEIEAKKLVGEKTYLDKANLLRSIVDLFFAGTETSATTIEWFLLYMVNYPDVQEKIFQDIKEVVGVERAVSMNDKSNLIFLEAAIMEVQRLAALLPLSLPRVVTRDVNLQGYLIPKYTVILVNFESVLTDPSVWGEDANKFRPERFIDKHGSLISPEAWIPFSLGRRVCLGESMAKMELFLFISNIVQRFHILSADPEVIPPIKGHLGLVHKAMPFQVRMVCRKSLE